MCIVLECKFFIFKFYLLDIDECTNSTMNNCDLNNGNCTNTEGGFNCSCNAGYSGDGTTCISESIRNSLGLYFKRNNEFQILTSVKTCTTVMKMQTAQILLVALHAHVILAILEMASDAKVSSFNQQ